MERFAAAYGLDADDTVRFKSILAGKAGAHSRDLAVAVVAPRLHTPALIVHDPDDDEVPYAEAQDIVAAWPGARLYTTRDAGHRRMLRDSGVVAEAVAFVSAAD